MVTFPPTPPATSMRGPALAISAIALTAVLVRLPYLSWPITPDEGAYAVDAYWWARGLTLYSQDLWVDRPQGLFLAYRAGIALFGDGGAAIRLWGALWFAASAIGVWTLARGMFGARIALLAGLLTALASASPYVEGFTANAEAFMLATATVSAALAWRRQFVWAGLAAGVSVMLKPSGASAVALCLFWLAYTRPPRATWLACLGAVGAPILAGVVHGWATVGVGPYLDALILYRATHPVPDQGARFVSGLMATALVTLPLATMALVGARSFAPPARTFWVVWLATSAAGVAMGSNWWPHYFVQLVPPLCLPTAALLSGGASRPSRFTAVGLALVCALAVPILQFARLGPVVGSDALYGRAGLLIQQDIASYIREHSTPDDAIYVAFSEPGLNYLAQRRSTVPWLYIQQVAAVEGALTRTMDAIASGVPLFVVLIDDGPAYADSFPLVHQAMGDRYQLEREYPGGALYRRR